jgi:hypothetical protein
MNDPRNPQDPRFAATQFAPASTPDQPPQQPAQQAQAQYGQPNQQQNPYAQPNPYAPPNANPYEPQQQAYGQPPAGYGPPQQQQPPGGFGYQQQPGYGAPPPGAYAYPLAPAATSDAEVASSLKALSILQYIYAAFTALGAMFVLLWVFIGGAMMVGSATGGSDAAGEAGAGVFMVVIAIALLVVFGAIAGLHVLAARSLTQRRRHTLLVIVACLTMLSIPIGTALGIWMLVVITKPEVKATFT